MPWKISRVTLGNHQSIASTFPIRREGQWENSLVERRGANKWTATTGDSKIDEPMLDLHFWIVGVRLAGVFHLVTLGCACFTPIPPGWDENLARLPEVHRRFAVAQNFFIGAVIAAGGIISLVFAPQLVAGSALARVICACLALWWGGRLGVLPWLGAHRHLQNTFLRVGYLLLLAECAIFASGYAFLALRSPVPG